MIKKLKRIEDAFANGSSVENLTEDERKRLMDKYAKTKHRQFWTNAERRGEQALKEFESVFITAINQAHRWLEENNLVPTIVDSPWGNYFEVYAVKKTSDAELIAAHHKAWIANDKAKRKAAEAKAKAKEEAKKKEAKMSQSEIRVLIKKLQAALPPTKKGKSK